jgi:MoxR-like ATPase
MTPTVKTALTIPEKFNLMETQMNGRLFERRRHVETFLSALIAKAHHCQYGPPGIGKTMLVTTGLQLIEGSNGFRRTLNPFVPPEDLYGPWSIKGLENDEFVRKLEGMMVMSNIAFLDELFKANDSLLNTLLTLMNEGLYFNGTHTIESRPLVFAGSNELPKDAGTAALWDRMTYRLEVKAIRSRSNMLKMLQAVAERRMAKVAIAPVITWDEILHAQEAASRVTIPDLVWDTLIDLQMKLRNKGIEPSDRRIGDCVAIIQAAAYREGRTEAEVEDMGNLRHALWMEVSQIPEVDKAVLELANPLDKEAGDLLTEVEKVAVRINDVLADFSKLTDAEQKESNEKDEIMRRGIEANGKLTRADADLKRLRSKVKQATKRAGIIDEATAAIEGARWRLLRELFNATDKK